MKYKLVSLRLAYGGGYVNVVMVLLVMVYDNVMLILVVLLMSTLIKIIN